MLIIYIYMLTPYDYMICSFLHEMFSYFLKKQTNKHMVII